MVDCANPRSHALDALREKAEGERWRVEEQRRLVRQLHGRCVECGGPIERVEGAGFDGMRCLPSVSSANTASRIGTGLGRLTLAAKRWQQACTGMVVAECGTGKTLISLGAIHVHSAGNPFTALAMIPPHLVEKWAREAFLTLPGVRLFLIDDFRNGGNAFSLLDCISVGVDRMQRNFDPMSKQVENWRESQLSDVAVKLIIYRAFIESYLEVPKHMARPVHDFYFNPQHEEFQPRTLWSLSNAFTSAFKQLEPIPQFRATAKLAGFLERT